MREGEPGATTGRIATWLIAASLAAACAAPGDEVIEEGLLCDDTTGPTLTELHDQVFAPSCAACHHGGATGTTPVLSPPDAALESIWNVVSTRYSGAAGTLEIVDPGAPQNSTLMLKVLGGSTQGLTGPSGEDVGGPMPQIGSLSAGQKDAIFGWICAGAQP